MDQHFCFHSRRMFCYSSQCYHCLLLSLQDAGLHQPEAVFISRRPPVFTRLNLFRVACHPQLVRHSRNEHSHVRGHQEMHPTCQPHFKCSGNQSSFAQQSPLDYFAFILCAFRKVEYVFFGSFLNTRSANIKAHTHFEQNFEVLRGIPKMWFCAKSVSKIIVSPKELQLPVSVGTFLTNKDVTNLSKHTPLCENEENEREILHWRLRTFLTIDFFHITSLFFLQI